MSLKSYIALLLFVLLGFACVWRLQERIDLQQRVMVSEDDQLMLRSSKLVKGLSLEYAPLVADIYWTRVVQYFGNKQAANQVDLRLLWPLLDVTSVLDPQLMPVYHFGSTFLSDASPRGAGRPDLAVELLERGLRANPDEWLLYYDLGFVYYFDMKDYAKASAALYEGSKNPKAFIWMKTMAAKIATEGNSTETSNFLWQDVYNTTKDPLVKQNALRHLQLLQAEDDRKQIDTVADEYQKWFGRRPLRMSELVQSGLLRTEPVDALGYPYILSEAGKAELNLKTPLRDQWIKAPASK
jgi:tetratricopeptide (TPR) repeat protein